MNDQKQLAAAIARSNKAFARMTPPQKRVAIAKDVLEQLKARKIMARTGSYLMSETLNKRLLNTRNRDRSLGDVIGTSRCEVCAVGAVFVCAVKKLDQVKVKDLNLTIYSVGADDNNQAEIPLNTMRHYLRATGAFTSRQLRVIEKAFEGWGAYYGFNTDINDEAERMRRVMQRLVDTGGRLTGFRNGFRGPDPVTTGCQG